MTLTPVANRPDFGEWDDPDSAESLGRQGHPENVVDLFTASLLTTAQIIDLPPPEWLVEDYLVRDSLAMLYGPSGTYKTFVALDLGLHVSGGFYWHQRPVERAGKVLYVIAEGARGIGRRIGAWRKHYDRRIGDLGGFEEFSPIAWRPAAVNLLDALEVEALVASCDDIGPDLVVLDTLARCTLGAEENSAKDMGMVIAALDRIRRTTGACVLVVHHTGKDASSGARGSSALKAAMDTELEMSATDDRISLKVTKQKDGAEPAALRLAVRPIAESLVLLPAEHVVESDDLPPSAVAALDTLREVQIPGGVATTVWKAACDMPDRSFYRAIAKLRDSGSVINNGTDKAPRYEVAEEVSE